MSVMPQQLESLCTRGPCLEQDSFNSRFSSRFSSLSWSKFIKHAFRLRIPLYTCGGPQQPFRKREGRFSCRSSFVAYSVRFVRRICNMQSLLGRKTSIRLACFIVLLALQRGDSTSKMSEHTCNRRLMHVRSTTKTRFRCFVFPRYARKLFARSLRAACQWACNICWRPVARVLPPVRVLSAWYDCLDCRRCSSLWCARIESNHHCYRAVSSAWPSLGVCRFLHVSLGVLLSILSPVMVCRQCHEHHMRSPSLLSKL